MKPIPKLCLLFMPFYAVLSVHPLLAQSYDEVVVEAGRLFQTGKYEESFTKAQQAVIADTNRFEGYFQAGLALYKTDSLDLARQYFSQAFERAPAPQKPRIQEALTFCSNKMQFNTHVRDAEVAEQNGMVAKAAREYTEAWRLLPIHEDVGFKAVAAQIQCEGWIPAAGILATIADSSAEENVKAKAKVDLSKFLPQADAAYRQQVSKTEALLAATNVEEALSVCQKLEEQWPQRNEAYFQQARALAAQGNAEGARNALMLTIKRARYKLDEIVNDPWLFRVTTNASFVSLLNDTFGEEAINSKLAERRAQQAGEARLRELTDKCAGEWVIAEKSFTRFEFWNIYTVIFNRDGTVGIRRSVYDSGKNALEMQDDDGVTVLDGSSWKPSIATNGIFWKYNQTDVGELSSYVWKCDYTFSAPGELTYRLGGDGVIKLKRRTPDLDRSLQLERMRPFIGSWCFEMPYHEKPKKHYVTRSGKIDIFMNSDGHASVRGTAEVLDATSGAVDSQERYFVHPDTVVGVYPTEGTNYVLVFKGEFRSFHGEQEYAYHESQFAEFANGRFFFGACFNGLEGYGTPRDRDAHPRWGMERAQ